MRSCVRFIGPLRAASLAALFVLLSASGCLRATIVSCPNGTIAVDGKLVCRAGDGGSADGGDASTNDGGAAVDSGGTCGTMALPTITSCPMPDVGSSCADPNRVCVDTWRGTECRPRCSDAAGCASAVHPNSRCIQFNVGVFACSIPCTPGDDSTCTPGHTCTVMSDPNSGSTYFTECRPASLGNVGDGCPPANVLVCGVNQACTYESNPPNGQPQGAYCMPQCRSGDDATCKSMLGPSAFCAIEDARGLPCLALYGTCRIP